MTDLKAVARLAGVSRATAARAFATPDVVRADTREKIFVAARELGSVSYTHLTLPTKRIV